MPIPTSVDTATARDPTERGSTGDRQSARTMRLFPAAMLLTLTAIAIGALPTYSWWHNRQTAQFKEACVRAVQDKAWERLDAVAARWVEWDPSSNDGWVYFAEAAAQLGEAEAAVKALGHVRDDYHGVLKALAIRGEVLFADLNRPYEAVATWERMLRINPRADVARQRLIYFYSMTLRRLEMLAHIRKAMELECEPPESYAYYLLANELNFSDGLGMVRKWRQTYPDDEALEVAEAIYTAKDSSTRSEREFGQSLIARGDLTPINRLLEKYPKNLEVLAFHLDYAIYDGDEAKVLELLGRCPPEAEGDARFWRYRAWYLASQGSFEEAEKAVRKSLELHPVDWQTWLLLSNILRRLEDPQAAEAAEISVIGKNLKRELFELPTARAVDHQLGLKIYRYLKRTAPPEVCRAMARRLE